MQNFFKTFSPYKNFVLAMGLLVCVLLPDFLINAMTSSNRVFWNWISFLFLAILCYGLTFLRKISFSLIWFCFFLIEIAQFLHIAYFGTPLFPSAIRAIFYEYHDIFDLSYLPQVWFIFPTLLTLYGIGAFLFYHLSGVKKNSKVFAVLLITYALSLIATDGLTARPFRLKKIVQTQPNWMLHRCLIKTPSPSLRSILFTLSCMGVQKFSQAPEALIYKPYKIAPLKSQVKNIVLIMGESFASKHMSLFGYHRKTTPHLDALVGDSRFLFKPSYSAAPNTKTSIMMFFNLIREPGHLMPIETGQNNLFYRAKHNGFKTFLITNNDGSRGIGQDIDQVYTSLILDSFPQASFSKKLATLKDKAFSQLLKELPLGDKNFIVLHMRSPHSPFERNYEPYKNQFTIYPEDHVNSKERIRNTYDNCIVYIDTIFKEIIDSFKEVFQGKGESYLIFTADHGELFGDKDPLTGSELYGHGHLTLSCVEVPFWMYSLQENPPLYKRLARNPLLSAYEVGELILNLIGEKLENPNLEKDIFYVNEDLLKKDRGQFLTCQKMPGGDVKVVVKK